MIARTDECRPVIPVSHAAVRMFRVRSFILAGDYLKKYRYNQHTYTQHPSHTLSHTLPLSPAPLTLRRRVSLTVKQAMLVPRPGYVIKARHTPTQPSHTTSYAPPEDNKKIFVNVFQHDYVDKVALDMYLVNAGEEEEQEDVCVLYGEPSSVEDKNGERAVLYNVCVGASHFVTSPSHNSYYGVESQELKIVSKECVEQVSVVRVC